MSAFRLLVRCRVADADAVSEALTAAGFGSLWVDEPLVQHTDDDGYVLDAPDADAPASVHAYPTRAEGPAPAVPESAAGYAVEVLPAEQDRTDRSTAWQDAHAARVEIVPGWVLVPPWGAPREGERALVLEPGGAFGTGEHPTTRACLRRLFEALTPGGRVLDLGAGSGVLSVAAVLWGAGDVLAVDVQDDVAELVGRNAGRNGIAPGRIAVQCADAADVAARAGARWDVVLCNVGAREALRVIERAGTSFAGACVVISGVFEPSRERVVHAARARGWELRGDESAEGWVTSAWKAPVS